MTEPEKQELRVKVAELCGYQLHTEYDSPQQGWHYDGVPVVLPDFCNDLNACSEFEKMLTTTSLQNDYQSNIAEICYSDMERANNQVVFNQLTATAPQRCQAFVKTREGKS